MLLEHVACNSTGLERCALPLVQRYPVPEEEIETLAAWMIVLLAWESYDTCGEPCVSLATVPIP